MEEHGIDGLVGISKMFSILLFRIFFLHTLHYLFHANLVYGLLVFIRLLVGVVCFLCSENFIWCGCGAEALQYFQWFCNYCCACTQVSCCNPVISVIED